MLEHRSTYHYRNAVLGQSAELERLQLQAVMGWEKEKRQLAWYGLQNGMKVLEVGSGPGFYTEQLLAGWPDSRFTSLEIDETLIEEAKARLTGFPSSRLEFVRASVYDTGLPEASYDFVIARLLFVHLHNPLEAAQELLRVLKAGGRLVIVDVDDAIFGAVHPNMSLLPSVIQKIAARQAGKGGNRFIGRSLPRLLADAGYTDLELDSVLLHSDLQGIEGFRRQLDVNRFAGFYRNGVLNEEEFAQMKQASDNLNESPDAYAMMSFVMACGRKP